MLVFARPTGIHSRAMLRVAAALRDFAPPHVSFTDDPAKASLRILHVIGRDAVGVARSLTAKGKKYVVIQYCHKTAGASPDELAELWSNAQAVWSYLPSVAHDIAAVDTRFVYAPLGIDRAFVRQPQPARKDIGIVTSGYMSGWPAEPIEAAAWAASDVGLSCVHIGPSVPRGMKTKPPLWVSADSITDSDLASIYSRSRWASAMRHVEGFEMSAIEALACWTRPIVFDRPDMRQWYDGHAVFVPDTDDYDDLVATLTSVMSTYPSPVTDYERGVVLERFSWEKIMGKVWPTIV